MNKPTKPGKRIVSKGRFVANTGKKALLAAYGAAVLLLGIGVILVLSFGVFPLSHAPMQRTYQPPTASFALPKNLFRNKALYCYEQRCRVTRHLRGRW